MKLSVKTIILLLAFFSLLGTKSTFAASAEDCDVLSEFFVKKEVSFFVTETDESKNEFPLGRKEEGSDKNGNEENKQDEKEENENKSENQLKKKKTKFYELFRSSYFFCILSSSFFEDITSSLTASVLRKSHCIAEALHFPPFYILLRVFRC